MEMQSVAYKCPNCSAPLEYNNEIGGFKCLFCDSVFKEDEIKERFAKNESIKLDEADPTLTDKQKEIEEFTGASALYSCPNCGASIICGELDASARCHFCHTPVILTGRLSGEYKPDLIIPFKTNRELAELSFKNYTKRKFLLPNGFKKNAKVVKISALYVPYWLKSGFTDATLTATAEKIRTWRVGNTQYTNTKIYDVSRSGQFTFVRVPCDGSKRIDDSLVESIEPFDYKDVKVFSMSYLAGCAAEKYDVPFEEAQIRIDERIKAAVQEELQSSMQEYSRINIKNCSVNFGNSAEIYALLPVWFLNYQFKGKDYPFVMNGQTGAHFGILPVSKIKAFLFGGGIFILITLIINLIGGGLFG